MFWLFGIFWIFFSLANGNISFCFLGVLVVPAIYIIFEYGIAFLFPLNILPFFSFFLLNILAWKEDMKIPKFWRIASFVPSVLNVLMLFDFFIIPNYYNPNHGLKSETSIWLYLLLVVFASSMVFFLTQFYLTNAIQFLINRLKTETTLVIVGKVEKTYSESTRRMVSYYVSLSNTSEKININLLMVAYLSLFAKGRQIEMKFKTGYLGITYCSKFPKILKEAITI